MCNEISIHYQFTTELYAFVTNYFSKELFQASVVSDTMLGEMCLVLNIARVDYTGQSMHG